MNRQIAKLEAGSRAPDAVQPEYHVLRRSLCLGLAALPLLWAGGCAGLAASGGGETRHVFGLSDIQPDPGPSVDWQLVVAEPSLPAVLDRPRVALQRADGQFAYFADAVWSDRLGALVRLIVMQSLGNSGRITGLADDTLTLRADYQLRMSIRSFQAHYRQAGQPPEALVVIAVQLVRLPERQAIAASRFQAQRVAERDSMAAIAAALDSAFGEVQQQIVHWTLVNAEADHSRR